MAENRCLSILQKEIKARRTAKLKAKSMLSAAGT